MTSNPVFTERNIQKANACLLYSHPKQNLPSLYVCVWLVNTLTSTAPIGSSIICMWSLADICEQWERNLSFGSADVRWAGTRDEPLRTSAWEAISWLIMTSMSLIIGSASRICLLRQWLRTWLSAFGAVDCKMTSLSTGKTAWLSLCPLEGNFFTLAFVLTS